DNLDRLVVSAERELREAENRRKRREAEQELQQSEKRLRELYAQADQLNRLKDEFLATLSHELRTPLNVIMGNSEILLEHASETGDEDARLMAEAIHRNAVHQTQLIDDLLDISSIITGKIRFEPSEIAPAAIIEDVVKSLRSTANAKNIQLNVDLNHVPAKVWADSARLQQILWNLLSNALKFTYKNGSIQVNVFREGLWVIFEVIDTGIGIDPEFLPNIYERFQQEDSSLTRRYGGLGLGLSIVRNLVDLHGGTVLARSEGKGLGATFRVILPYSGKEGNKVSVASTITPSLAVECH
ncbi:MAG: HAMP domain-containing histidine kinase, partial [Pseudobdellovibrionaceae bacterium]|nr:HAMP domain-containing histidine kinase [Pseudobdellovibrionaceae bacterium]